MKEEYQIEESLSKEEMENVTVIDVEYNEDITSLKGIEYFQNLQTLNCLYTGIESLDVSKNINLIQLYCGSTGISSLDISNNTKLVELHCASTSIKTLDISNNTNLEKFSCSETEISSLNVSNHLKLDTLNCASTNIATLDISKNINLMQFSCAGTGISSLNVSNNINLDYLDCSLTNINSLDISKNTKLVILNCEGIGIFSLDVNNHPNLSYLNCDDTGITELDVSNNPNLEQLHCNGSKISRLDVSKNINLVDLYCGDTKLSSLDISKNTRLEYLDCIDCVTPVSLTSENTIDLSKLPGLDVSKMSKIQNATLSEDKLIVDDLSEIVSYTYDCGKDTIVIFNLEITSYEIKYDANGGTGQMPEVIVEKGELSTLPENGFTAPSGMQFKEWAVGSIDGEKVKAGEPYTFTGITTVYAIWEKVQVPVTTYAITFHANGGTGQMAQATATEGKALTLPHNNFTAPSGKRFKEWAIGSTGGVKVKAGSAYTFTEATTVYAVWEPIPSTEKEVNKPSFQELQLKAKASKRNNKLSWKRVKRADGYVVYGAKKGNKLTEIAETKGLNFTHKKLSKNTYYQYQVKAYRLVSGEKKFIAVSQNIYSVTTGGNCDNPKKLTVNASKFTLKKGKYKTIKAKLVGTKGKKLKNYTKAFRYETSNSKVATVSAKGKIKARKKGKCTIYVYTQNGLSKSIRVTVK